ncbi:MAG: MoaD/ThiS family protein [Aquincola tertiaricarbonis]|uniref:MoaD/ThiS family protein n=1 Tax=Aquincola tertiaricarbonis TaxID=391953 RepID=UPI000614C02A|nr:MoaD/ThiS family protein [Aquincola tertiaricarbonis]
MKVQVRYFASLREALGSGEAVELPAGSRVADLRAALVTRSPLHAEKLGAGRAVRCAVDQLMCQDEAQPLPEGAEVAFFPPVTGG